MSTGGKPHGLGKATQVVHSGHFGDPILGEVSVPIFQTSTFAFPSAEEGAARFSGQKAGYIYTRLANPTVRALEDSLATLEKGFGAMATATGMAAINTVFLALLDQGGHVVSTDCVYGATRVVLESEYARFGVRTAFVDTTDLGSIEGAIEPSTRLVFIETPTNPTMKITDIREAAAIAHRHGIPLVVDNTFASPYLQRPLELGADIVVHSLTKFLNGHSDVVGGAVVTSTEGHFKRIRRILSYFGGTMDPHQAWLILRGIKTLALRLEKAQGNALRLAEYLQRHPKVTWVRYPGLPGHPQFDIARKQMDGFGSMLCFGVKEGLQGGVAVMNSVRLITLAVSLGGVETLIEHPASMTHTSIPRDEREAAGISDDLVRLSVGCEDFEDLKEDLDQALSRISD
ncbi:MAG: aminotransferase class I/II-fold pyridoxal phosphate-dependent enzyme [Syntrophobacteraceae bacterium]|jgi:methionine-gamma-lyase|nr:aminotransferase class I/II-fold pyridoxal phosphate-dependent enzyme [Syntrophobacteraceae bacterium]MCU0588243.1 aminotransferase class I/II-fold pyridoxal phosphate-dependent enzyme [Syntrophobacteraceae bacterium]